MHNDLKTGVQAPAKEIRLTLSAKSNFPTVHGKWKRLMDGRIVAHYTSDELRECERVARALGEPIPVPFEMTLNKVSEIPAVSQELPSGQVNFEKAKVKRPRHSIWLRREQ